MAAGADALDARPPCLIVDCRGLRAFSARQIVATLAGGWPGLAFIAAERLTRANLLSNPHAVYLFKETDKYEGKRLYLTKIREEKDSPLIDEIRRKKYREVENKYKTGPKYLIYFKVDKVLPLIREGKD